MSNENSPRNPPPPGTPGAPADDWLIEEVEGGPNDPFFREETRIPDCDDPAPPSLIDRANHNPFAHVRELVAMILNLFPGPATLRLWDGIWQRKKFEMLDWLRPVEKLLRRILLIEAYALLETQALPPMKMRRPARARAAATTTIVESFDKQQGPTPGKKKPGGAATTSAAATARRPAGPPYRVVSYDPDHPERWRVTFNVIPRWPRRRKPDANYRRPGPVDPNRFPGDPRTPLRHRRVVVPSMPLARRLEAVIRICQDPAPFIRRLAFRLRSAANATHEAVGLLCARGKPTRIARETNFEAAERLIQRRAAYWSSS